MVSKATLIVICALALVLSPVVAFLAPKTAPAPPPKMELSRAHPEPPPHPNNTVPVHPSHGGGQYKAGTARQSGAHLTYYGGPITTGPFYVDIIFYNNDINTNNLLWNIYDFVNNLGSTSWAAVMNQYYDNTGAHINGANIHYGGYAVQPDLNAPCASPNGQPCTITDAQIQTFLKNYESSQYKYPDLQIHYAVFFDQYVTISSGGNSCQAFCGYHSAIQGNRGNWFTYSVYAHPAACGGSCGSTSTVLQDLQSIMSHEIAETMTDAEVNINGKLGWYDSNNGEIGDICAWQEASVSVSNGNSYTVQKIWSNAANACVSA